MRTDFSPQYLASSEGQEANAILRSCVHCGFCTATCPTYLLTGNELDSPRGRIYLIKEMLEDKPVTDSTRLHLDRCLTCLACETTCPSNVQYHSLLNIGRAKIETLTTRSFFQRSKRFIIRKVLTSPALFSFLLGLGRTFSFLLWGKLKRAIPVAVKQPRVVSKQHIRKVLLLNGCLQNTLTPNTNAAIIKVLDKLGIECISESAEGCCGALDYHMNAQSEGLSKVRHNIDVLLEKAESLNVEAIISSASGCGSFYQDYPELLKDDEDYATRAFKLSSRLHDLSEYLEKQDFSALKLRSSPSLAFHCPCTLQHGMGLGGKVEELLTAIGFDLKKVKDSHLCCGSAGSYSILQPELSQSLRTQKLANLKQENPDMIATANIGCQLHLQSGAEGKPVKHWIEIVAECL